MKLFAQIRKVDEEKRLVYGRAVQEVPDHADEIFDYEKSVPYFKAWNAKFSEATDGKSLGNIRAMHGKVAAGKIAEIEYLDDAKAIDIAAKIVDDAEWGKVLEGVYTGFSIGGSYVGDMTAEKINGKDVRRYVANPSEISIVDFPCVPGSNFFEIHKSGGAVEKIAFQPPALEVKGTNEEVAAFAKALNDHGMSMADATGLIEKAAAEKDKAPDEDAEALAVIGEALKVGKQRTALLKADATLTQVRDAAEITLGAGEFDKMVAASAGAGDTMTATQTKIVDAITEKGVEKFRERLQAAHDHIAAIGAMCGKSVEPDLTKTVEPEQVTELQKTVATLTERIEKMEKLPVPHVLLRAVTKSYTRDPDPAALVKGESTAVPDAVVAAVMEKGHGWAVKNHDGTINFEQSAQKLANETGAAA